METVDWIILAVYACSTIALGWHVGRKQSGIGDYFLGGGRMHPVLVGVSLFATLLSTITYLAMPGEMVGKGPVFLTNYLSYPLVFLVIGFVVLPVYMKQRVTSAYELLEAKLGVGIRLLGVGLFLALRLVWMSFLVFLTAKALAIMMGLDERWVPVIVAITGFFVVAYTSLGGLRAVVITDLMQTLLLYGGALLVIGTVTWKLGGFGWVPSRWQTEAWDHQPWFSFDPSVRVTVVGTLVSVFFWTTGTLAGDQVSVQRFMATKDARTARRAVAVQLTVNVVVGVTLGIVGLALLGFYQARPEALPEAGGLRDQADRLFPHFIAAQLPPVVTGLVVSGLFAAAMSSIDSGVNSITAVVMTDVLERFGKKPRDEAGQVRFARRLALGIGIATVALSGVMDRVPGNFLEVASRTVNLLTVPISMLFVFALFVPFASPVGVWLGTGAGIGAAALVAFSGSLFGRNPETGLDPVSFQWMAPAAFLAGAAVGTAGSLIFPRRSNLGSS
jgi:SSS family solute:Na+ symporter